MGPNDHQTHYRERYHHILWLSSGCCVSSPHAIEPHVTLGEQAP